MCGFKDVNVLAIKKEAMKEIIANIERLGLSSTFSSSDEFIAHTIL